MIDNDMALLQEFARTRSEEAFRQLVFRHTNLVYSVAWRNTLDQNLAEEVTQAVFLVLARKAGTISTSAPVSGWLCRTTRNIAANSLRTERRRQRREQESFMRTSEPQADPWAQIEPWLEKALEQLSVKDHDAIVMHYFEGKKLAEVAAVLGTTENAAKTRVSRALDKLRIFFGRQGFAVPSAAIAAAITVHGTQAAPVGLAAGIVTVTLAPGAVASGPAMALMKGVLQAMAWAKIKTVAVLCVGVLALGGVVKVAVTAKEPQSGGKTLSAWIHELYAKGDQDMTAHFALIEIGDPAVPRLVRELSRQSTPARRALLADVLGGIGPQAWPAVPELISSLGRPKYQPEQFSAAVALGQIGRAASNAVPSLVKTLGAEDFNVRMEAAMALARIGIPATNEIEQLTEMLEESRPSVCLRAALALWRLQPNSAEAFNRVREFALRHPDESIRSWAMSLIKSLGPEAKVFLPVLNSALTDTSLKVQASAQDALRYFNALP